MRAIAFAVGMALAALSSSAFAATTSSANYVDLKLVLAVDVSGSMDNYEQQVQRQGYVQAFRDPAIVKAILSGPYGRIAVTYVQWAGAFFQDDSVPWTVIASPADATAFAAALDRAPIYSMRGTSLSGALLFSASQFKQTTLDSDRMTIDVSGDGSNNDGAALTPVRDQLVKQGITINGLPIVIGASGIPGGNSFVGLDQYYHDCVIGGPASFVVPISSLDAFGPAIRRKLILEIASAPPQQEGSIVRVVDAYGPPINCAAAEILRSNAFTP